MEIFDLYNADRIPLGETVQRGLSIPENRFRIAIHVCIFNSKGEMLIQQRQPFKKGWSNYWDVSCGGSAIQGENSASAAHRETLEELGTDISFEGVRPVLTVHFDHGFDDIYTVTSNVDINSLKLQYEEVQGAKWATEEEILSMIADGTFIPYHEQLISLLFFMRNHRGTFKYDEDEKN